jgi:hypothetical protein
MGIVELTKGPVDRGVDAIEGAEKQIGVIGQEVRDKHLSPPGALGLPPLLEKKRLEHEIPDFYFTTAQAVYDRVLIVQLVENEGGKYAGTRIEMTNKAQYKDQREAPRGVIISAGLHALDALRSNGIDIGHTVYISRMSTYRIVMGVVMGKDFDALVVHAGEITMSEDLLHSGARVEVRDIERDGVVQKEHFFVDEKGEVWNPVHPNFTEDY